MAMLVWFFREFSSLFALLQNKRRLVAIYVQCIIGFISYLMSLAWTDESTIMLGDSENFASSAAYLMPLPAGSSGSPVFRKRFDALLYIERLAYADMECRSIKPDRIQSSCQRIRASFYLAYGVCLSDDRELWKRFPSGTIDESLPPSADQQKLSGSLSVL